MPLPDYQEAMQPLLELAAQHPQVTLQEAQTYIGNYFKLTDQEKAQLTPSGSQTVIKNRVGWAKTFLKKAELIEYPGRARLSITQKGRDVLANHSVIDIALLKTFPEFEQNWLKTTSDEKLEEPVLDGKQAPDAMFENLYQQIKKTALAEIAEKIQMCSPEFFEHLVVRVIVAMGYGGTHDNANRAIGRSGDGGIDGVINKDRLGLDTIYLQAKRWKNRVGRPEIHQFSGALQEKRANKGIFITASDYSAEAIRFAESSVTKIILIDGAQLAEYMWEYDIGVRTESVRKLKIIDAAFFEDVD